MGPSSQAGYGPTDDRFGSGGPEAGALPANTKIGLILPGQPRQTPAEPVKLILPEEKKVVDAQGETTSSMTWPKYVDRRQFSCKPRIVSPKFVSDKFGDNVAFGDDVRDEQCEDVNQATLEFIGEVGEVAELVATDGYKVLYGDTRNKIIDECGDVLFTGTWLIEAWSRNPLPINYSTGLDDRTDHTPNQLWARAVENPLLGMEDTEFYRFTGEEVHARVAIAVVNHGAMAMARNQEFVQVSNGLLSSIVANILIHASLTANSAKKLAFQFRERDPNVEIERVLNVFAQINLLLCMANSSIEDAMIANRAKIDARYPEGYKPGVGGGIRTEG